MEGVTLVDTRVWFGCDMASAEREHITGVWQSPQRSFLRPWTTKGDRKFVQFRTLSAYIINHRMVPTVEQTTTIIST